MERFADFTYGDYGSNWNGMLAVLHAKYHKDNVPHMWKALQSTGDDYLLEHNNTPGRDVIWSDNFDGTGSNWLGMQLMLIRDEINAEDKWTSYIKKLIDIETGSPIPDAVDAAGKTWADYVMEARNALCTLCPPALCSTPNCEKPTWNGLPGDYCSRACRPGTCKRPWCGKYIFTDYDGYCSEHCRDSSKLVLCQNVGCGKPTWNGKPGCCSMECSEKLVRELDVKDPDDAEKVHPAIASDTPDPRGPGDDGGGCDPTDPICLREGCKERGKPDYCSIDCKEEAEKAEAAKAIKEGDELEQIALIDKADGEDPEGVALREAEAAKESLREAESLKPPEEVEA